MGILNQNKFLAHTHAIKMKEKTNSSIFHKIRSFCFKKFHIWDIWDMLPYRWSMIYFDKIKPIFSPQNKELREFIPRTWRDISHLMIDINFEMIKIFYEKEYKLDIVDWEATTLHKEFAEWLEKAYRYITIERPQLEKDLENAYPEINLEKWASILKEKTVDSKNSYQLQVDDETPYEVKYAEVHRIEKLLDDTDTKFLKEFIDKRDFFWT